MEYRLEQIKVPVPKAGGLDALTFESDILRKFLADTRVNPAVLKGSVFKNEWFVTYKLCDMCKSRTVLVANTNDYVLRRDDRPQRVYFTGTVALLMYKGIHLATYSYEQSKLWIQYNWEAYDVTDALTWLMKMLFDVNNMKTHGFVEFNNVAAPRGVFKTACALTLGELSYPRKFNKRVSIKPDYLSICRDNIVLYGVRYNGGARTNVLRLSEDGEFLCEAEQPLYIDGGEVGLW